jgi:hypothetical protein
MLDTPTGAVGSRPAGELAALVEDRERARGARHEDAVAAGDLALEVLGVRVRCPQGTP